MRNENGMRMRAGGYALTLLGAPRTLLILRALADGAGSLRELRSAAGLPASSTLRGSLARLERAGVVARQPTERLSGPLAYELTPGGARLLTVAEHADAWLRLAPHDPLELGDDRAYAAIRGLVEGWAAAILATLSTGPHTLTELDNRISAVSYPTIERCLKTLQLAELIVAGARTPKGSPYSVTKWLRRGVGPLAAAARWESRHGPDGAEPVSRREVESAAALVFPLLRPPAGLSGTCQLVLRRSGRPPRRESRLVAVEVVRGSVSLRSVYPPHEPDAWASGTPSAWFSALIEGDLDGLRTRGSSELAATLFDAIHETLFAPATPIDSGGRAEAA